jgi:PAS domain S-box-containing protein
VKHPNTHSRKPAQFDEAALLGLVHDAVIASDLNGVVQAWNTGAHRVYGYTAAEMIGRNIREVYFPEDLGQIPGDIENPVQAAADGSELRDVTLRRRHKSGRQMLISLRIATIRDEDGRVAGFVTCSNDITQRKCAEDALFQAHAELEQRIEDRTRELRTSRERLDHLLLSSPGVLYSTHSSEHFQLTFLSRNAESVFGRMPGDAPGESPCRLDRVHIDDRAAVKHFPAQVVARGSSRMEYRYLRATGEWRIVRDSAVASAGREVVGYCLDITEERAAESARLEKERLSLFAEALLTTQEAERKRISRELHDDLSQRLATLILDTGILEQSLRGPDNPVKTQLRALKAQAASISDTVRALAHQLHSAGLEQFGLSAALENECAEVKRRCAARVRFRARGVPPKLPENVSLCLYRVAQECLRNVVRHSNATDASVTLSVRPGAIVLRVKDNGCGFDMEEVRRRNSLGIVSMNERVRLVNGKLTLDSRREGGTLVEAIVPILLA